VNKACLVAGAEVNDSGEQLLFMPFTNYDLSVVVAVTAIALW